MAATIINPVRFRNARSTTFNYIMEDSQHINDLTLNELYLNNMNIHLGTGTGNFITHQGTGAIAIGAYAGQNNQGTYSIAIGGYAGQQDQPANSIILNATSAPLNVSTGGFFVSPINRNENYVDFQNLGYNPTTKEIVYSFPIAGVINIYAGASAPLGTLLCDGSAVSRTTYSRLFSAIGTTYGVGDGSTTFNLPNLKGKVPVGRDAAQTEFDTLGEVGGEKTHTLDTTEIPSHSHTQTTINDDFNNSGGNYGGVYTRPSYPPSDSAGTITWTNTINSTGGGLAHNNLQPYIVMNYIISY